MTNDFYDRVVAFILDLIYHAVEDNLVAKPILRKSTFGDVTQIFKIIHDLDDIFLGTSHGAEKTKKSIWLG